MSLLCLLRRSCHTYTAYSLTHKPQAVITLFLYLFAIALPAIKRYRGYMLPLSLALTYLWLTSLIFSSQDYAGGRCSFFSPPGVGRCGLKHTVQAFFIIGLWVELGNWGIPFL